MTIYLNQAGTSWPKPEAVVAAATRALTSDVDNWSRDFEAAHHALADSFSLPDASRLLLTPGCTSALALAIADHHWQPGDCVVTSSSEHHAVHRPLLKLAEQGVELEIIPPSMDGPFDCAKLAELLATRQANSAARGRVKMVAVTAASNVTGDLLPLSEIRKLTHEAGALLLVDGAQLVGWQDVDLPNSGYDLFAFGGHKGFQAPWGIGGLYVAPHVPMHTPQATCDIASTPADAPICHPMPGYCDGGSVDRIALAGLHAALRWLDTQPDRLAVAREQVGQLRAVVSELPESILYGNHDAAARMPTLAFNIAGRTSASVAKQLQAAGIIVGSGLQCAPLAHQILGTAPEGVVRLSVGPMTTNEQIDATARQLATLRTTHGSSR